MSFVFYVSESSEVDYHPKSRNAHEDIHDAAEDLRTRKNPGNEVEVENADKQPIERADDHEDHGDP